MKEKWIYGYRFTRALISEWQKDNGTLIAAGLSFFGIFSLFPLLLIAIAILSRLFSGSHAESFVLNRVADIATPVMANNIQTLLTSAREKANTASVIGLVLLLWTASRIFTQLQTAMNIIWEAEPRQAAGYRKITSKIFVRLRAIAMALVLGVMMIFFFVLDIGLAALRDLLSWYLPPNLIHYVLPTASFLISVAVFTLVFALVYKWLPKANIAWKNVWLGASVGSALFALGRYAISLYFRFSDVASPFGAAGSIIVVIMWIYFSTLILLMGAEFTWVYSHRDRFVKP